MRGDYASDCEAFGLLDAFELRLGCAHVGELIFHLAPGIQPSADDVVDQAPTYHAFAV